MIRHGGDGENSLSPLSINFFAKESGLNEVILKGEELKNVIGNAILFVMEQIGEHCSVDPEKKMLVICDMQWINKQNIDTLQKLGMSIAILVATGNVIIEQDKMIDMQARIAIQLLRNGVVPLHLSVFMSSEKEEIWKKIDELKSIDDSNE